MQDGLTAPGVSKSVKITAIIPMTTQTIPIGTTGVWKSVINGITGAGTPVEGGFKMGKTPLWLCALITWAVLFGASYVPLDQIFPPRLFGYIAPLWVLGVGGVTLGIVCPADARTTIKWVILFPPACLLGVLATLRVWFDLSMAVEHWHNPARWKFRWVPVRWAAFDFLELLSVVVAYLLAVVIAEVTQRRLRPLVCAIFTKKRP